MNYMFQAFGGFKPHVDEDAAVKFALCIIFLDHRLEELSWLLTDGHVVGGVEGEPGWIIERRDERGAGEMPGYLNWPEGARFHVHIDPDAYQMANPDIYMAGNLFRDYVRRGVEKYAIENPDKSDIVGRVFLQLGAGDQGV